MKIRKKALLLYGGAALSLLLCGVTEAVSEHIAAVRLEQYAAQRWEGEISCGQMTACLSEADGLTTEELESVRNTVDAALTAASIGAAGEDARLWYDAYSTDCGSITVSGSWKTDVTAEVTAVGGDFFTLHTMQLKSGGYIYENDLMQDRVVLDEELAWQLFGSSDVAGMTVTIDGMLYSVAGVVAAETDYAAKAAYGTVPRMYISYALYENWQTEIGEQAVIGCYEAVLPCPVRGFAKSTVTEALGTREGMVLVENSGRFSLARRWQALTNLHELVIVPENIYVPYWENAARITDFDLALLLVLQILLLLLPVGCGVALLWQGYRGKVVQKLLKALLRRVQRMHRTGKK